MPHLGKRIGDSKKARDVKQLTFHHNPNDSYVPDPVQQFDILTGVEKEKKVRPKDVFENYKEKKKVKPSKVDDEKTKHRSQKMAPLQERGKKRGLEKKKMEKGTKR